MNRELFWLKAFACLVFFFVISTTMFFPAIPKSQIDDILKTYSVTKILPINTRVGSKVSVVIEIPFTFRLLGDNPLCPMTEFIPKTDIDVNAWSEMITTQFFKGDLVRADGMVASILDGITHACSAVGILDQTRLVCKNYLEASFTAVYAYEGRVCKMREIFFGKYFSGPYDCCGLQYVIRLTDEMTQELALKKIKAFVDSHVRLL